MEGDDTAPDDPRPQVPAPESSTTPAAHARTASAVSFQSSITNPTSTARRASSSTINPSNEGDSARSSHWLRKMTSWLTASEPSTRALKQHKKDVLRKAGIADDDREARAKLQVPGGEIPPDAVRPDGKGVDPEDALRRKRRAEERRRRGAGSSRSGSGSVLGPASSHSGSSRSSKTRGGNPVFPFE